MKYIIFKPNDELKRAILDTYPDFIITSGSTYIIIGCTNATYDKYIETWTFTYISTHIKTQLYVPINECEKIEKYNL